MNTLENVREALPAWARDQRLNLDAVLAEGGALSPTDRWGVAVAVAAARPTVPLLAALVAEARLKMGAAAEPAIEDGLAAASLMAMNNVFYRFRHMIGKPVYTEKPARLRMNRLAKPATTKAGFELMALAVSAVNGCEACVKAHETVVLEGGLTEDHVHEAVRIAAVVQAVATALEAARAVPAPVAEPALTPA